MENGEKSFRKLFDILEWVASGSEPRTVREIAGKLELPESTVYRILKYLARRNYVERTPRGFLLGGGCLHLGAMAQEQNVLQQLAHPELMRLAEETRETVHLAKFNGNAAVYIDKCDGARSIRMGSMIGRNAPLHCTGIGKAMLAALPERELAARLQELSFERFTANTVCDADRFAAELARTRERGYAVDDCEHEEGVFCIAAAVIGRRGKVEAGLSVAGMSLTLKPRAGELGGMVCAAARRIAARL